MSSRITRSSARQAGGQATDASTARDVASTAPSTASNEQIAKIDHSVAATAPASTRKRKVSPKAKELQAAPDYSTPSGRRTKRQKIPEVASNRLTAEPILSASLRPKPKGKNLATMDGAG